MAECKVTASILFRRCSVVCAVPAQTGAAQSFSGETRSWSRLLLRTIRTARPGWGSSFNPFPYMFDFDKTYKIQPFTEVLDADRTLGRWDAALYITMCRDPFFCQF